METLELKRHVFIKIANMGDHSFKAERNGKYYFVKSFEHDKDGFEKFVDNAHTLKMSGVVNPKLYLFDKKKYYVVVDFVEGENVLNILAKEDLTDAYYESLFKTFWFARNDRFSLDFRPENFILSGGKLYYLPFTINKSVDKDKFLNNDLKLWFFTKEAMRHFDEMHLEYDSKRLLSDFETNKKIALMTVKYYK